ncbi:MAG: metal-dependent transcriptional regulator, partial [Calditrichaeota bacterium]|nr:metal-dependent transcriptional regulator [Calditrichota bacterium]MCB0266598.1 metal-dependent transcriptional regulator [Calditrichota bacterium]MCB0288232.1 metal-dependent transcriptional regulator [Calditrichota bacterium]MCB0299794.1 metal-dependent transcriptional regulator [Calditrichota bacterium]MCB9068185.1 metal-dependent transcriptional regulator [Calditrichia bacterium]
MYKEAIEDYLKAIYNIQQENGKVATTTLAKKMSIAPASATGMIKRLSDLKLVTYEKYQGVKLTRSGEQIALEVIRHHRLIELFLAEALGLPWDKVHDEAEKWEHVLSDEVEERIDQLLGYPTRDPHGAPIPGRDGKMPELNDVQLTDLIKGQQAAIVQVNSKNPELLRYLGSMALYPDTVLVVLEVAPFDGPVTIEVDGKQHILGRKVAENIFVEISADGDGKHENQ